MATEIYADQFGVTMTPYIVSIRLGEGGHSLFGADKNPKAVVKIPLMAAKELAIVLRKDLKEVEERTQEIPVSGEWMAKIGIAPEDQEGWW